MDARLGFGRLQRPKKQTLPFCQVVAAPDRRSAVFSVNSQILSLIVLFAITRLVASPAPVALPGLTLVHSLPASGPIVLHVDATDVERRIFRVSETVQVTPGPLTLYYPKWIPGHHSPTGPVESLAGLFIKAGGQPVRWKRDPLDMHTFRLDVPAGVRELKISFDYLSSQDGARTRVVQSPELAYIQWDKLILYPQGPAISELAVAAKLTLPTGWAWAGALEEEEGREDATVRFRPVSLDTLIDSPLFAGRHHRTFELVPGPVPVRINVFADTPEELDASPEQLAPHRRLVDEALSLFGARHFDRYDFLLSISDNVGGIGLEHQRSSENGVKRGYFREWEKNESRRVLLAHELVHSWNGKFRRPADLCTPDYNTPMQDSLLWVYEGLTEYWGVVLAARSGLWSLGMARGYLAYQGAMLDEKRAGRSWRNLQDTTNQPIMSRRVPQPFVSWQRTEDYYREGVFLWLDTDTKIRELTGGTRSLDDFARAFFGQDDGRWTPPSTYTFADVVSALNGVVAFDWASFLRERLDGNCAAAPRDGLRRGGWRNCNGEKPAPYQEKRDTLEQNTDFGHSMGLVLDHDAKVTEVVWGSPAFRAGITTACTLIAVKGLAYKPAVLQDAVHGAGKGQPLELLIRNLDRFRTVSVKDLTGLRYPALEWIDESPDLLSTILQPRVP